MTDNRNTNEDRPSTPDERTSYTGGKANPNKSIAKFDIGNSAWIYIAKKGNTEVTIVDRKAEGGIFYYKVKDTRGVLYGKGWVAQEKLSDC
ncbi:hypothetical protein PVAG01_08955 [Phlyctema vagabunda]|uniref:SH3 domain-containing protein n=1 Tax=Phlyctema vagabunda TaxID=108571 RepID=A0ABR4PBM7_9HELO